MQYMLAIRNDRVTGVFLNEDDTTEEKLLRTFHVPEEWEMYTTAGDRSVANKVQKFVTQLANGVPAEKAATTFFKSFKKLYVSDTMGEATDTAVREAVLGFVMKFKDLFDHGADQVEMIWETT